MLVTGSATRDTIGLLVTFLGIGVIAQAVIGYAIFLAMGERRQNQEHRASRPPTSQ